MSDVRTQAQEVFRQVFDDPEIVLRDDLTADDFPGWDSLTHINLMVAMEKRFKIKFATAEISKLKENGQNVGTLLGLIDKKLAAQFMNSSAVDFNVSSVEFIAAVLLAATVFFWLPGVRLRQSLWACGNLFVLWLVLPNLPTLAAPAIYLGCPSRIVWMAGRVPASPVVLAIFLGSGYLVVRALRIWPSRWLLGSYLAVLIAAFMVLKQYPILDWVLPNTLRHIIWIIGLSYILFRQIHVLVDAAQGQIERISLWSYVNYQLNLFTILAGPIQRFQDFEEQWRTLQPVLADRGELLRNCMRLLVGVLKIALIAPLFYQGWNELQITLVNHRVAGWKYVVEFPVVFYFYPLFLYCNFAGYCDIVLAASRFLGMNLPENFNRPWLARNVIDFWTRWHITLGTWIRDYLFMPMYKPVVEHWPKQAPSLAWIFYFPAFVVAGAWHGGTANFVVYGALQGLGASAGKIYENAILASGGRKGLKEYGKSPGIRLAAILLHLHYQCFTLLFFSPLKCEDAWSLLCGLAAAITGYMA